MSTIFHEHNVYGNISDLPLQSVLSGWSPPWSPPCQFYQTLVQQYQLSFVVEVSLRAPLSLVFYVNLMMVACSRY